MTINSHILHGRLSERDQVRQVPERIAARDEEIREAFAAAGLAVENRAEGLAGRGLWVGVKPRVDGTQREKICR